MRSLYDCLYAKVRGTEIKCAIGYELNASISTKQLALGKPLYISVCQGCPDFNDMGRPLSRKEKGWVQEIRS